MAIYKSIHYPYVWSWSMCGLELQLVGCLLLQLLCWLAGMASWRRVGWLGRYCGGCLLDCLVCSRSTPSPCCCGGAQPIVAVDQLSCTGTPLISDCGFCVQCTGDIRTNLLIHTFFHFIFLCDFRCLSKKKRFSQFSGNDIISTKCWCNICPKCPP